MGAACITILLMRKLRRTEAQVTQHLAVGWRLKPRKPVLYGDPARTQPPLPRVLWMFERKCDEAGQALMCSAFILILTTHREASYGVRDNMGASGPSPFSWTSRVAEMALLPTWKLGGYPGSNLFGAWTLLWHV